ncbi:U-box domain-containing [Cordyceps militaris]|uniref:U-box domain-containing n=1 Tax=Cordyceps militaris TaxID=73501 RepID=A0A2H4SII7_CORMI|nr:U-box domain-containing [Cordyceps militaris]
MEVPTELWREFCAAHYLLTNLSPVEQRFDLRRSFLEAYFGSANFDISATLENANTAYNLHSTIVYFISDLTKKITSELGRLCEVPLGNELWKGARGRDGAECPTEYDFSKTEYIRLYRAFLRFEIYSQLFKPRGRAQPLEWALGTNQFNGFLSYFQPWEVEEITCVHQYFADFIEDTLDNMEDAFEAKVDQLIEVGAATPGDAAAQDIFSSTMGLGPLRLYSFTHRRLFSNSYVSSIVANGLMYMLSFARGDTRDRCIAIRKSSFLVFGFLLTTLDRVEKIPMQVPPSKCLCSPASHAGFECPMVPNQGYRRREWSSDYYMGVENKWHIPHRTLGGLAYEFGPLDGV